MRKDSPHPSRRTGLFFAPFQSRKAWGFLPNPCGRRLRPGSASWQCFRCFRSEGGFYLFFIDYIMFYRYYVIFFYLPFPRIAVRAVRPNTPTMAPQLAHGAYHIFPQIDGISGAGFGTKRGYSSQRGSMVFPPCWALFMNAYIISFFLI